MGPPPVQPSIRALGVAPFFAYWRNQVLTKLEIINRMLAATGIDPVENPNSLHPDAQKANNVIDMVNMDLQSVGYWFNKEYKLTLSQDQNGHILIPSGVLRIDPVDTSKKYTRRGNKLYDPVDHTFNIGESVVVDIVNLLDIEDLPYTASAFIRDECVLQFFVDEDGDPQKGPDLRQRKAESQMRFKQAVLLNTDTNSNHSPVAQEIHSGIGNRLRRTNPNIIGG